MRRAWTLMLLCACRVAPENDAATAAEIAAAEAAMKGAPGDPDRVAELGERLVKARELFKAADLLAPALERFSQGESAKRSGRIAAVLADAYLALGYFDRAFFTLRGCLDRDAADLECLFAMASFLRSEGSPMMLRESQRMLQRYLEGAAGHRKEGAARAMLAEIEGALAGAQERGRGAPESPNDAANPHAQANPHAPMDPHAQANPHAVDPHAQGNPHAPVDPHAQGNPHAPADPHAAADPHAGLEPEGVPGHPVAKTDEKVGELNAFGQLFGKAMSAARAGDHAGAAAAYREALALRPEDPSATAGLAATLMRLGRVDEAVALAKTRYERAPKDAEAMWLYASVLVESGADVPRGIEILRGIVELDPELAREQRIPEIIEQLSKAPARKAQ